MGAVSIVLGGHGEAGRLGLGFAVFVMEGQGKAGEVCQVMAQ